MNSVFLSGRLETPIQVMSSEDAPLHIKAAIRVPHFTAAGIRKSDVFTLSAWRGIAKRFMDQERISTDKIRAGLLDGTFPIEKDRPYLPSDAARQLAGIVFGVSPEDGQQLLLIPEIHAIMSAVQQAVFVLMNARE